LSPVGINATVIPPSPPPVNPAPPSGSAAKKEARQRQAATAKSEEGGQDSASEGVSGLGGDRADGPPVSKGAAMTRHGTDGRHAFTALAHPAQPSAWARDALYGGGIGIAALVLALGFTVVRPTPRRRSPSAPVPAWARLTGPRERR
jgi:hypothetical protein